MDDLVSVIIPIYNVEHYVDKCINSVVHQTYKNIEIILINDGSQDSCPQKCDYWSEQDERIVVIHQDNKGIGMARNKGIEVSSGDYITFVDSDDYIAINAIEIMLKQLKQDKSDLIAAQKMKVYADGTEELSAYSWMSNSIVTKDEAMHMVGSYEKPFPASVTAKLYRKSIFDKLRFSDLKCGEDTHILPHIVAECKRISITDVVVYYYYQRTTSTVHSMTREHHMDSIRAVIHVARFLIDNNYTKEARIYYNSAIIRAAKMNNDKEAEKLIRSAFSHQERMLLKEKTLKKTLIIWMYKNPLVYRAYSFIKKMLE